MVTGGSGFLGGFVIREAHAGGHEVVAVTRSSAAAETVTRLGAHSVPGDLDDPDSLDEAFDCAAKTGAEVLVNLASLGFGHAPTIVAATEEAGLSRAVFVSTTAVTTALPAPSKRVRLAAEQAIQRSALDWTIIRPTMIYGAAGDRNIARLLALLRRTPVVPVPGGGRRLQQPVHVQDLAQAVLASALTDAAISKIYDVAGPQSLTFRDLLREAGAAVDRRPRLLRVPMRPTIWALQAYEKAASRPRFRAEQLERLSEDKTFDISAAVADLDFRPRSFRTGVGAEAATLWN
ncbi:MAG: SDR family oxidoreductase [Marmoricola sp.]